MDEDKYKIPLFDGKNYSDWSYRVELYLDEQDLLQHIENRLGDLLKPVEIVTRDTAAQKKEKEEAEARIRRDDKRCKNLIVSRIQDGQLETVKGKNTAFELWAALRNRFHAKSVTGRVNLLLILKSLVYRPKQESFREFCLKFDKLIRELRQAGDKIDAEGAIIQFLMAMPSEYESVVSPLQTMVTSDTSMDSIRVKSKAHKTVSGSDKTFVPSAAFVGQNQRFKGKNFYDSSNFPFNCNNCGKKGHRKSDCFLPGGGAHRGSRGGWSRGRGQSTRRGQGYRGGRGGSGRGRGQGNPAPGGVKTESCPAVNLVTADDDDEPVAYSFLTMDCVSSEEPNNIWFVDSGASDHMIQSGVPVTNKRKLDNPVIVKVAKSDLFLTASEIGDVIAYTDVNGVANKIQLNDVLIINSDLPYNLISVSRLEKRGCDVLFSQGICNIMVNGHTVTQYKREGALYRLPLKVLPQ